MEPDQLTARSAACSSCGAALRGDAPWCTLCYADLRPQGLAELSVSVPHLPRTTGLGTGEQGPLARSWPCSRCGSPNPLERDSCSACGAGFLAAVRDDQAALLVLPGIGDLAAMGRGKRFALAAGLVAAVLLPLALATVLLTDRAPDPHSTVVPSTSVASVPAAQ